MEYLKLSKYLINIINEYFVIDFNKLIKNNQFRLTDYVDTINPNITIEDILVKSFQLGYCGFYVSRSDDLLINYLDSIMTKNIEKEYNQYWISYRIRNDNRNMYLINIIKLENVIISNCKFSDIIYY